ncbi:MAG: glutathione S-transferase family protein [Bdellovibrionales bacterium]|nr:glutathione S-transferase family protein [Bdellovibrionales bacterium]
MAMTLIGSYTSPFVRKIRLLLFQDKTLKFEPVNYFEDEGREYLKKINPFNQLPMLLDGDQPIYESRVMFNYISKKYNLRPLTIDEENILSAIDTTLSSAVNLFSLRKGGIDIDAGDHYFIERQKERLPSLLGLLAPWAAKQDPKTDWNYLTMSLYSLLFWLGMREMYDINLFPEHKSFLERFKNCPGVAETDIPKA